MYAESSSDVMKREQILSKIGSTHTAINQFIQDQTEDELHFAPEGKWSSIEHVVHLSKALAPLEKALRKPKFLLRYSFGRPNRPGRDYEAVKKRYYERLASVPAGVTSPFVPKEGDDLNKDSVLKRFRENQIKLNISLRKWNEEQLDKYLLPHPLMGKLTVREMLYFIDFHAEHHLKLIQSYSA